jgi:hypothetical protein
MRRFRLSAPSPAMIVACLALITALGGTAYAAIAKNSVKSPQIAPKAVKTSDLADSAVKEAKLKDGAVSTGKLAAGSVTTDKIADGAITGAKISPLSVGLGDLGLKVVSHFTDAALPDDGQRHAGVATCPAGEAIVGGGASFTFAAGTLPSDVGNDLRLLSSRPGIAPDGAFPADGSTFDAWRATGINDVGGADGDIQITVQAICLADR